MSTERTLELARSLPREEFVKKHPGYFLVITDRGEDEPPSSFETVDVAHAPSALLPAAPSLEVHAIVKAPGNPYPERISIGRARNCDIALRYASVSKLHAIFSPGAEGPFEVVDLDSQFGTRVNGRAAQPNERVRVGLGFIVMLGRVVARIADARMVWDLVRAQAALDSMSASPGSSPRSAPRSGPSSPGVAPRAVPSSPGSAPRGSSPPGSSPRGSSPPGSSPRGPSSSTPPGTPGKRSS
jgi:hypothetical protein